MNFPKQSKYPKEIRFSTETYRLRFVKKLDCYGETDWGKKEVRIKKGLSPRATFTTLIHELLHVIEYEYPVKLSHRKVYKLEQAIFEMLVDNFL